MVENGIKNRGDLKLLMNFIKKIINKFEEFLVEKSRQSLKIFGLEKIENFPNCDDFFRSKILRIFDDFF